MWFIVIIVGGITVCSLISIIIEEIRKTLGFTSEEPSDTFVLEDSIDLFEDFSKHQHSGRCEGDCSKCPAHYGYRHGRWYYGHDHSEGCEFGGNKCGGGL